MALGMSFGEVIQASTEKPAQAMGLGDEIGTLRPGALADVALFRIESGDFTFYDVRMNPRKGTELVRNTLTIVNGREMPVVTEKPPAPWFEMSDAQRQLTERNHTPDAFDPKSGG